MFLNFLGEHLAELIAICALFLTSYQAYLSRKHNRLSLKPHLTRFTYKSDEGDKGMLCFEILNNGVGPAFIKTYEVLLDGNVVDDAEAEVKRLLGSFERTINMINLTDDYVMKSGEKLEVLKIDFLFPNKQTINDAEKILDSLDLKINYESVYGEKFSLDTRN